MHIRPSSMIYLSAKKKFFITDAPDFTVGRASDFKILNHKKENCRATEIKK
jgi:hypothetical protein